LPGFMEADLVSHGGEKRGRQLRAYAHAHRYRERVDRRENPDRGYYDKHRSVSSDRQAPPPDSQ
jgi:hypothetical protein